jgi:SWI/SNF related-matrix-associated actin-dependent regulator of chromatin subfamily C
MNEIDYEIEDDEEGEGGEEEATSRRHPKRGGRGRKRMVEKEAPVPASVQTPPKKVTDDKGKRGRGARGKGRKEDSEEDVVDVDGDVDDVIKSNGRKRDKKTPKKEENEEKPQELKIKIPRNVITPTPQKQSDAKRKGIQEEKDAMDIDVEGDGEEEDVRSGLRPRSNKRAKRDVAEEEKEEKPKGKEKKEEKANPASTVKKEDFSSLTPLKESSSQLNTPAKLTPASTVVSTNVTPAANVHSLPSTPYAIGKAGTPMPPSLAQQGVTSASPQLSSARPVIVTGPIPTAMPSMTPLRSIPRTMTPVNSRPNRGAMDRDGPATLSNISHFSSPLPNNTPTTSSTSTPAATGLPAAPTMAVAPGSKVEVTVSKSATPPFPLQCSWFKINEIHDIEKTGIPEFFCGRFPSKTPQVYKEYRDFMINTYLQNPQHYLTQTACRRNLAGDVGSILRVHQFLEHWGLINYHVSPDTGGFIPIPPPTAQFQQNPMQALYNLNKQEEKPVKQQPNLTLRHNLFGQTTLSSKSQVSRHSCSNCGKDCSTSRFYCQKLPADKKDLCSTCFAEGCYPDTVSSSDFLRADDVSASDQKNQHLDQWTDQETLLLLEGLELYNDNWAQVADHVGTKSKDQCLLHFLRLPIEDPYAEDQMSKIGKGGMYPLYESSYEDKLPFSESTNPVMAIVAFLSSAVSPVVAAAAAASAMKVITGKEEEYQSKEADKSDETMVDNKSESPNDLITKTEAISGTAVDVLSKQSLKAASAAAVAAAAVKAELLAKKEEREIRALVAKVVEFELTKLELKLKYVSEIENSLDRERVQVEKARQSLYQEKMQLTQTKLQRALPTQNKIAPSPATTPTLISPIVPVNVTNAPSVPLQTPRPVQPTQSASGINSLQSTQQTTVNSNNL